MSDSFGKTLSRLMRERGYTQTGLSQILDVSPQAVSKYVAGTANPAFDTLLKLSIVFDVPLETLLEGELKNAKTALIAGRYSPSSAEDAIIEGVYDGRLAGKPLLLKDKNGKTILDLVEEYEAYDLFAEIVDERERQLVPFVDHFNPDEFDRVFRLLLKCGRIDKTYLFGRDECLVWPVWPDTYAYMLAVGDCDPSCLDYLFGRSGRKTYMTSKLVQRPLPVHGLPGSLAMLLRKVYYFAVCTDSMSTIDRLIAYDDGIERNETHTFFAPPYEAVKEATVKGNLELARKLQALPTLANGFGESEEDLAIERLADRFDRGLSEVEARKKELLDEFGVLSRKTNPNLDEESLVELVNTSSICYLEALKKCLDVNDFGTAYRIAVHCGVEGNDLVEFTLENPRKEVLLRTLMNYEFPMPERESPIGMGGNVFGFLTVSSIRKTSRKPRLNRLPYFGSRLLRKSLPQDREYNFLVEGLTPEELLRRIERAKSDYVAGQLRKASVRAPMGRMDIRAFEEAIAGDRRGDALMRMGNRIANVTGRMIGGTSREQIRELFGRDYVNVAHPLVEYARSYGDDEAFAVAAGRVADLLDEDLVATYEMLLKLEGRR